MRTVPSAVRKNGPMPYIISANQMAGQRNIKMMRRSAYWGTGLSCVARAGGEVDGRGGWSIGRTWQGRGKFAVAGGDDWGAEELSEKLKVKSEKLRCYLR